MAVMDGGPTQDNGSTASNEGPVFRRMLDVLRQPGELLALLTVVGAALYGFFRILYDRLYSRIGGVTPDEVGLSYVVVISRAAVAVMILVLLLLVILRFTYASGADWRARGFFGPMLEGLALLTLVTLSLGIVVAASARIRAPWGFVIGGVLGFLVFWVVDGLLVRWSLSGKFESLASVILRTVKRTSASFRATAAITLLAMVILIAFSTGTLAARDVRGGGKGILVSGFPGRLLLNIQASPAQVKWLGDSTPQGVPPSPEFIYLGSAEGTVVLLLRPEAKLSIGSHPKP